MNIISYEPKIEKAISKNDAMIITKKEYEKLKKISKLITEYVENILISDVNTCGITKLYIRIAQRI